MLEDWRVVFKALAQPTRLKIVLLLANREHCVCELERVFQISQPAISQHMGILKASDLVKERSQGRWVFYSLNKPKLKQTLTDLALALDDPENDASEMQDECRIEVDLENDPSIPSRVVRKEEH